MEYIVLRVKHYAMDNGNKGLSLIGFDGSFSKDNNSIGFPVNELPIENYDLLSVFEKFNESHFPLRIKYVPKVKTVKNKGNKDIPTLVVEAITSIEQGNISFKEMTK